MNLGDKFFVRIDYRNDDIAIEKEDFNAHVDYLRDISKQVYLVGGGFSNKLGRMILIKSTDISEAKKIFDNDPIIKKRIYHYEIFEWDILLKSNEDR